MNPNEPGKGTIEKTSSNNLGGFNKLNEKDKMYSLNGLLNKI